MAPKNPLSEILTRLNEFKKKYYLNLLIKGLLMSIGIVLSAFMIFNFAEYFGRFNSVIRGLLLFSFLTGSAVIFFIYVIRPIFYLIKLREPLSDLQAAKEVGDFFPEVSDRLVNLLQLSKLTEPDSSLLNASIEQKSSTLKFVNFSEAIRFQENKKYLKYALPPLLLILFISAISPKFFLSSSERIVKFRDDFNEEAPFDFVILNKNLEGVKNADFTLSVQIEGDVLPDEAFVLYNNRKFKMNKADNSTFSFLFNKLNSSLDFQISAAGFSSKTYTIRVKTPPNLLSFDIDLNYPTYLSKRPEKLQNVGNMVIPEGTTIQWNFAATDTDSIKILFDQSNIAIAKKLSVSSFGLMKRIAKSTTYDISLKNSEITNPANISYYINVIPDKFPELNYSESKDSTLFNYILLGGNITDDYGLSQFKLFYKNEENATFKAINIPINKEQTTQRFYYQFDITKLNLNRGDKLYYYLELWDNDGVNGPKSTKSALSVFEIPSISDISKEIDKDVNAVEKEMSKLLSKSKDLKKSISELDKKLKVNSKLGFQEKKDMENILKQKQDLQKQLEQLAEDIQKIKEKQQRFNEPSPQTQEKMNQLQELMNELMKDENSELYKQLEELLKQNNEEELSKKLEQIQKNERNLDRNIDRTLKLFKNLQLKQKAEEVAKDLEKLADKQEELANESEKADEKNENTTDNLLEEQKKLSNEFDEQKKKMEDIEKLSKELDKPMDQDKDAQDAVDKNQEDAQKQLEMQEPAGAAKAQKKAARSLRNMSQAMSAQMQSAEMKELDLNIDALRDILENVVKLSFDQENVLKNIRGLSSADPRFVELSQEQIKLVDDAKIIEDSLYSLAQKVMQIESFVTKEVTNMNNYMDESLQHLKDRKLNLASAKQQFSMTSINNLALLLSDTFKQMQQMMMAMSMPGNGSSGKTGQMPSPGIGKKQSEINKRLDGVGKGGSGGRKLSEELAEIAQEQARLRREVSKLQDKLNGTKEGAEIGKQLSELEKEMNKSEEDIVNKRINPALIKRQQQIETRLLEAEKAIKKQELDNKRESQTGRNFDVKSPEQIEKLIQQKSSVDEFIRTTPPTYTPFYKSKTNLYLNKIK